MDSFKERLLDYCKFTLERKIELISFTIDEIISSMENETKSSAGDKHETARARMQAEQERLQQQLKEFKDQKIELQRIDISIPPVIINSGSLAETTNGLFFITVGLGKLELEEKVIYAISPLSPLAIKMKGMKVGEEF